MLLSSAHLKRFFCIIHLKSKQAAPKKKQPPMREVRKAFNLATDCKHLTGCLFLVTSTMLRERERKSHAKEFDKAKSCWGMITFINVNVNRTE